MERENGDDYIRRTATFVRTHEKHLADAAIGPRRRAQEVPKGSTSKKPLMFTDDPHHLFYLLMRFEGLGIDVGSLDVHVKSPSRPTSMSYLAMLARKDKSDVLSISSFRSTMSSISMFSLGGGWFGRAQPATLDAELKYLYSAFTKLPALSVRASGTKVISELADDPPTDSAIPMDALKNLQTLECHDIDPRSLIGWDRVSEGLRSLTIKRSGLEDVSDFFVDAVIDDNMRRQGNPARVARSRLVHHSSSVRSRQSSFHSALLPPSVPEDSEEDSDPVSQDTALQQLPPYAWSLLTHLSLSDNNLTFLPSLPSLPSLLSLDLSSNLLISIPTSLSSLIGLKSLNLAHNMVDSVLGIYSHIPSIISLNLSSNRLESLCGLERLEHLSRVDLRDNRVEDIGEIGRLAVLADVNSVWVTGNPCTRRYQDWRVRCFDLFAKEGREVFLDGSMPGLMESRAMAHHVDKNGRTHLHDDNGRPLSESHSPSSNHVIRNSSPRPASPCVAALEQSPGPSPALSGVQSIASSPDPAVQAKARRRKNKRIVDLDANERIDDVRREPYGSAKGHGRHSSDVGVLQHDAQALLNIPGHLPTNVSATSTHDTVSSVSPGAEASSRAFASIASVTGNELPSLTRPTPVESPSTISRIRQGAGTSRTIASKSNKRRLRLSPSMYEPASASQGFPEGSSQREESTESSGGKPAISEAEKFRQRIEALRHEVGDSWLKVLSQTHLASPDTHHKS